MTTLSTPRPTYYAVVGLCIRYYETDYCNSVLAGLPMSVLAPLRRALSAVVLLVPGLGPCYHATEPNFMKCQHWLPITGLNLNYAFLCTVLFTDRVLLTSTFLFQSWFFQVISVSSLLPLAFSVTAMECSNLPAEQRLIVNIRSFKKTTKTYFIREVSG